MRRAGWMLGALVPLAALACNPVPAVEGANSRVVAASKSKPRPTPRASQTPETLPTLVVAPRPHPLDGLTPAELAQKVRADPQSLGPLSIGRANRGALFNAVQMPESEHWQLVDPERSWATQESIDALSTAIQSVVEQYPDSPRLFVGDMSKRRGGYFRPHRSHQSGRDVDIGYYYLHGPDWYKKADADTLDRPRTWTLIKALLTQGSVEYLFVDRGVQQLLKEHALAVEHDDEWVRELFGHPGGKAEGTLRHVRGHRTHMHVRFHNGEARESARRTHALLARYGKL